MTTTFGNALIIQKTDAIYVWFLGATREIDNGGKQNGENI